MKNKNAVKIVIAVIIAIIAFIIFSMTRFSDDVKFLVGYFKFQMLHKNMLVNIKREPMRNMISMMEIILMMTIKIYIGLEHLILKMLW